MIQGIYNSALTMMMEEKMVDVTMSNISRSSYAGYMKEIPQMHSARMPLTDAMDITDMGGISEKMLPNKYWMNTAISFAPGKIVATDNSMDLAIKGDGFFAVQTPRGTMYTRNGSFSLNEEGVIVTDKGYPVLGDGGQIQIPVEDQGREIFFDDDGNISQDGDILEKIRIVEFENPHTLKPVGLTLFETTGGTIQKDPENSQVKQGFIEYSNVNMVREMVDLIVGFRAYQASQKMVQDQDETLKKLFQIAS